MEDIEKNEWICKGLKKIRIRGKDLDIKDRILRAMALWRAGYRRRLQEKAIGGQSYGG